MALNHFDESSIEKGFARVIERYGRLDVLINNAYENASKNWDAVSAEQFNQELMNATGYFLLARLLWQHATQHNRPASIVMVASMYGLVGSYPRVYEGFDAFSPVGYHALKGGILQLTRHLAVYWAKARVRVNSISPGPFPKPGANPDFLRRLCEKIPMGRIGGPGELKGGIVFLASDASSYMTGQNLVIDGGWTAW
jgi:gluconate 5-dehydrogenase